MCIKSETDLVIKITVFGVFLEKRATLPIVPKLFRKKKNTKMKNLIRLPLT